MFLKIIYWQILQWTQLPIINLHIIGVIYSPYPCCVIHGDKYICNFIDNFVIIFHRKKCTERIFSLIKRYFASYISVLSRDFYYCFPLLLHSVFITWFELKFMVFLKTNGRCNSIIPNTQHRRIYRHDNNALNLIEIFSTRITKCGICTRILTS